MVTIVENKKEPCIYLRYFKEDLQYIGESSDTITGRPFRKTESNHQWDKCRILKAPKDKDRRRYWEAVLIVKLKPKTQKIVLYQNKLKDTNILQVKKLPYGTGGRKYVLKEISLKKKTEQMRCENNQEKMKYWAKQALVCKENIKMLEKQMTESILCYKHFKEDAEKKKKKKNFKYLREMNER